MNIKSTLRTFMAKVFIGLAVIGFFIIGCIDDIPTNGFSYYFSLWGCWLVILLIAVILHDPRLLIRYLYAAAAVYIVTTNRDPKKYSKLYEDYRFTQDNIEFYFHMVNLYDEKYRTEG